jgi:putative polyketide hydroxylase
MSAIDLVGQGFVLLAGAKGAAWAEAARAMQAGSGIEVAPVTVGNGVLTPADERWRETYGIDDSGAVLVRPDGYVAWRSASASAAADPAAALAGAMAAIQGRAS